MTQLASNIIGKGRGRVDHNRSLTHSLSYVSCSLLYDQKDREIDFDLLFYLILSYLIIYENYGENVAHGHGFHFLSFCVRP